MTTPYDYGLSADTNATWSQVAGIPDSSHVVRDPESGRLLFDPEPENPGTHLSPVPGPSPVPEAGPGTAKQTGAGAVVCTADWLALYPPDYHPCGSGAREYVTEISVPRFGDGGRLALYSPGLREPEPEAGL